MKMRGNICCCLLAFVLSCNVTAAIIHEIVEEKDPVFLSCPHSVEGKVTWGRERDGRRVDILTADGDRDIRHNDPGERYRSLVDKSLYIHRVTVSDTGRYFCNNEPAVELTVIPSGTTRLDAAERTTITLKCPPDVGGSDVPTWSRDAVEIQQQRRFHVSTVNNTLIITDLQPADSGLYYCDGKLAAYLTVSKDGETTPTSTTSTTTTSTTSTTSSTSTTSTTPTTPAAERTTGTTVLQSPPKDQRTPLSLVIEVLFLFLFIIINTNIIICCRQRRGFERQGRKVEERGDDTQLGATGQTQTHRRYSSALVHVVPALPETEEMDPEYDDIEDGSLFQSTNDTFPPNEFS
ncbi:uncharacterized protein LOC127360673 isoform X2 [Dicentrarchus labrax]|uniref:uncharacterized protein LOC127360673 isoform X2 n=1 Tax=Dicentrarchus labrax TaxID=13489 RepID=UPI0021F55C49|nr:uncharacterized protein LOC127360673 isoform X2 [Dicentrarchus labrax]